MGHCGAQLSVLYTALHCVRAKAVCLCCTRHCIVYVIRLCVLGGGGLRDLESAYPGVIHHQQCTTSNAVALQASEGMHALKGGGGWARLQHGPCACEEGLRIAAGVK